MAKLGVAYGLCPLIDQESLLGVSEDSALDCVIVTIGKNIVNRYKLQDQKQVSSWSTKDKLTSQVIYNELENKYFGVFNQNQLRFWSEKDDNLDTLKKYKFQSPIFSVLSASSDFAPIIIFKSGSVQTLESALKTRKDSSATVIKSNESIEETFACTSGGESYIILLTSDKKKKKKFLYIVPLAFNEKFERICLQRIDLENIFLRGFTVSQEGNSCYCYTLWSDSRLYSFRIMPGLEQNFPGTFVHSTHSINSSCPAVLVPLSSTHMVIYGADPSEEGAMMILLNLQFQLIQSRLHFKLFGAVPRMWKVGTNLLLAVGHNLVVVPSLLDTEHLSALVGSHKPFAAESGLQPVTKVTWVDDSQEVELFKYAPLHLKSKVSALASDGWPESVIFSTILSDLLDKKDIDGLLWCLKNFSDISEDNLVQILKFCLNEPNVTFEHSPSSESYMDVDSGMKMFTQLQPEGRACIIEAILAVPVSDVSLVPHLRLLPLSEVLLLLKHLAYWVNCNKEPFIIDWMCALLDAHYQQFILSKDPEVLTLLSAIRNLIKDQISSLDDYKKLSAIIPRLKAGKPLMKQSCFTNKTYSIEMLRLY